MGIFLDWKFWPNRIKSFYYRITCHKYIVQECTWISSSAVETWFLHFYSITSLIVIDEQHISDELQVHLNHALPIQGNIVTLGMCHRLENRCVLRHISNMIFYIFYEIYIEYPPYSFIWPYLFNWHLRVGRSASQHFLLGLKIVRMN